MIGHKLISERHEVWLLLIAATVSASVLVSLILGVVGVGFGVGICKNRTVVTARAATKSLSV